jgi:glycosyltransferase involved in cell wall biosynthesis
MYAVCWAPREKEMVKRIYVIRTRYAHWGAHSGINQFIRYIDQSRYQVAVRQVSDGDDDFPIKYSAVRSPLRRWVQRKGMAWYKLSDLTAEVKVLGRCLRNGVDVVHYLDGEHSAQYLPRLLKRAGKGRIKLVATFHQPAEILDSLVIKDVISKLDQIIVVSPDQAAYFEPILGPDRFRVILHGVDTDYFRPANKPIRERVFKCITAGHYLRDFEAVRRVAEKLIDYRDIEFHIVTSKTTGLEGLANVILHRNVDDATLLDLYQGANALFLPLLGSTANNALLEGIACGLPVISTLMPSIKTYVPGREAILIEKNDSEELAQAILHLFEDRDAATRMAGHARKRAEELSWQNIAPQYEAVYSSVMGS